MITNQEIAKILFEISEYLEMQDVPFKPRAYEKAAGIISGLERELAEIYEEGGVEALGKIPGIGLSIAQKIEELIKTGRLKYYEKLKKEIPVDLSALSAIEGLGAKSIKKLYKELNIRTIDDLEKAALSQKIRKIKGFGAKTEENILKGIEFVKKSAGRFILGFVMPEIESIKKRLGSLKEVKKITIAGSVRRWKETIGDVDILVAASDSKPIMNYFVNLPEVERIYARGETKSSVKLKSGLDVDLRVIPEESYGAALNYFTGSKEHNIALRELAIKKGYKLNEYGLFKIKNRRQIKIAGSTEEGIYNLLGLDYIPPEMRENKGEIELAKNYQLPKLIEYEDLMGDLQVQTDWTDGSASIETMVKEAIKHGFRYIAITDHTKHLAMTHGLDEKMLLKQMAEIDRLNKKFAGKIKILKGTECDILKDGSLDLKDEILAKLDIVGASVHSYFNLSKNDQTERIKKAMENPNVDIIFHPTGRIINRRAPYEIDIDYLIKFAKIKNVILEVNAYPDRLDLKDDYIRKCVELGVRMSIDSDAHAPDHFFYLKYGIAQARRGWAQKKDIINAWPLEKMLKFLRQN